MQTTVRGRDRYVVQSFCNKLVPVTVLTAWSTLVPIFSIIFGYFDPDLRTKPKVSYLGALPILAGLWMITLLKGKKPTKARGLGGEEAQQEDEKDGLHKQLIPHAE